jgi:hypothetical protein
LVYISLCMVYAHCNVLLNYRSDLSCSIVDNLSNIIRVKVVFDYSHVLCHCRTCMYACMYVCTYIRTYVCMYVCKNVCMYACSAFLHSITLAAVSYQQFPTASRNNKLGNSAHLILTAPFAQLFPSISHL